ncbi:MAG: RHS repeat-associated core domain-containing protein [Planctomycetaceae bacterium]
MIVYSQWRYLGVIYRNKLTAQLTQAVAGKPASTLVSGHFGIQTGGKAHHYIDDIIFSGKDAETSSPLSWTVDQKLNSADPAIRASLSGLGSTRTIQQSLLATPSVSLTAVGAPVSAWSASDWQTVKLKFVAPAGSTVATTRPAGGPQTTPDRIADLSRQRVIVRTSADGRMTELFINDVLYETNSLTGPAGAVLQLETDAQSPGIAAQPKQYLSLSKGGSAQVLLRASQYSAADLANVSDQLASAYDQIPVLATGVPATTYNSTSISEKLLSYATVRLLTSSDTTEDDISRMTESIIVRPTVSVGLISFSSGVTYQPDAVFFARPKDLTVDFPAGQLLYVPRNGASVSQTDAVQQSRALLTLTELAARENELLSELSDKPATSALTFLSLAELNDTVVRRLRKNVAGAYFDEWDSTTPPSTNLATFLNFGTGTYRTAAFNAMKQQLDAGGIVTASTAFRSVNGWTGVAWLHENYTAAIPVVESLLLSDADGRVLHGGVLGDAANQATSNVSLLPDSIVAPDAYQGILKKADTDFTVTIPGLSIPFTRTWTSSRSDATFSDKVVTGRDISDLGAGWMHPFAQTLDISTITESVVYYKKKKNLFGQVSAGSPVTTNADRAGEAALIAWRREDGSVGVFAPNGTKTVDANGYPTSADYTNPTNLPGTIIRRLDGAVTAGQVLFGDFYEVRFADGAVYKFKDFNTADQRRDGGSSALLISMADRFGNTIEIQRSAADPTRITQIVDVASQRVLAKFAYNASVALTTAHVPGVTYETQTITLTLLPPDSTFILSFAGQNTAPIAATATAATVQTALRGLTSIGGANVTVSGPNGGPYVVSFAVVLSDAKLGMIGTVVSQIEVPATATGAAPTAGVTGTRLWNYSYDTEGNLSKVTASESTGSGANLQPANTVSRYAYTWYPTVTTAGSTLRADRLAHLMKSAASYSGTVTDAGTGLAAQFAYYGNGRLRSITDPQGAESHFIYNAFGRITSVVDAQGNVTTNQFSDLGEMVVSTSASGERTIYDLAPNVRQVAKQTSTSGRSESWEYDAKGNATKHTDAAGISQIMTYHPVYNQVLTIDETSASGTVQRVLTNTYFTDNATGHAIGALATSTDALSNLTSYTYTAQGLVAKIVSPKGHSTRFDRLGYDVFGNPIVVDHLTSGNTTPVSSDQTVRDNTGNVDYVKDYTSSNVLQKSTDLAYDQLGRLTSILAPDPYIAAATLNTQYLYGRNGLIERRINPDGSIYRYEYDSAGRPVREIRHDGTFTTVQYNPSGTVASQTDANGNKTRFVYDVLNRLSQTIFANGTSRSLLYNAKGDLISETDERGSVTKYEYDTAGRLTKTMDPAGNETSIGYDEFGNQTTAESAMGVVTTTFNAAHQPVQVLYSTKANSTATPVKVRVDHIFYDANGNQERSDIIDLRKDPVKMTDTMIASLIDSSVTRSETDTIDAKWKRITTTTFDFRDKPISSTDAGARITSQTYSLGTLTSSSTDASGGITRFGYDLGGGLQFEALPYANATDVKGLSRVMRRDKMGRVVEILETPYSLTAGAVVRYGNGEPAAPASSEAAKVTKTSFDTLGRPIATQNALGFVTRVTFDPAGNVVETIDASRRSALSVLDNMNRVVKQILPAVSVVEPSTSLTVVAKTVMPTTVTAYDPAGNVIASTDPAGKTTTFQYDSLNRMILKTAPEVTILTTAVTPVTQDASPTWAWTYDALGHVATSTDPLGRVTVTISDMFGQVISTSQPDPDGTGSLASAVTEFTFDAFGNLLISLEKGSPSTTADDRLTVNEYNSLNLKTKTTLPIPGSGIAAPVLQWSFDTKGNLTSSTDARNNVTNYTYDLWNRVIKTELPAVAYGTGTARPTTLTLFDVFGDVIRSTDAMGRSTTFEHDALGRTIWTVSPTPLGAGWTGSQAVTSTTQFDAVGNVIRVIDQLGRQTTTAYDNLNRPIRTTGTDPYLDDFETAPSTTVAYDINGNVARQTDAAGHVTRFEYDALNRKNLVAIQNTTGWLTTSTQFDLAGNTKRTIDIRGNATDYNFDSLNRVVQVQQPAGNSLGRPTTTTAYDQFGNVKTVVDPLLGETQYEYDNLNRLTRQLQPVPEPGTTRPESVFAYDAAGNRYKTQVLVSRSGSNVEVWTESITTFDAINRSINSVVRATNGVAPTGDQALTAQTYDLVGNVLSVTDALGRVTTFEYDRLNRRITEIDPKPTAADANPVTRFTYDTAGNLAATIDPLGRITTTIYDRLDRALTTTSPDPDGFQGPLPAPQVTSRYDILGNVLSTTDQLGRQTVSTYDIVNRVLTVTQPDADLTDNLAAPMASFVYNLFGDKIKAIDALGNITDFAYDVIGRLASTTSPDASLHDRLGRAVTSYGYDLVGNVITTTDAAGRITSMGYDKLNRLISTQLPDPDGAGTRPGPLTLKQYDAVGNVVVTTDYINSTTSRVTTNEFDYMNRVTKTTLPAPASGAASSVTTYGYDKVGNQISVAETSTAVGAIEKKTMFVFDDLNRLVQTQAPHPTTGVAGGGPISISTFDLVGRLISSTDPLNRVTSYFYDDLNRVTKTVGADPDGLAGGATTDKIPSETRTVYDPAGNLALTQSRQQPDPLTAVASSLGIFSTTINRYDRLDRLSSVIDANGGITQYRYDNSGNRIQLTDASFNTTRWQYDAQGQVVSETDANQLSIVNEYDLMGNVFAVTDRRGYRTQFLRNNLDNVLQEHWLQPSGSNTAFVSRIQNWYDAFNRVYWTRQTNPANAQILSEVSLSYDDLDRILVYDTVNTPGQSLAKFTYQYDAFDNRTQMVQQTGSGAAQITVTTNYTEYDYLNRLTKLNQTATNFPNWLNKSAKLDYRADSSLQTITRYRDLTQTTVVVQTDYTQDLAGRLASITHTKTLPTSTTLASYQYTYFADDQLLQEISSVDGTTTNGYDAYGQLVTSTKTAGANEAYAYDKTGNRLVGTTVVGKGNRILNDGTYAYEYDGNGNLTRRTTLVNGAPAGAYIQYTWDQRNQLTKIEFYNAPVNGVWPLNKTVSYSYDGSSNRISKTLAVPGQTSVVENYVYDGDQLVAVMDGTGVIQHEYFNGSSMDQVFADQTALSSVLWPLEDRTGAARDIISTVGVVLDHRTLDSFGNISSRSGSSIDYDQFFSGLYYDVDSQLYYARARWYDATSGKFLGEDPLRFGAGDTNLTRYSANDPVNNSDPSGLLFGDIGEFFHDIGDDISSAAKDVGHFFEKQWDNGNIQKGLLVAGTIVSGGALAFGGLAGMGLVAGGLGFASGVANSYEVFSGNQIGDGTFTRVLSAAAAVTGGFYGNLPTGSTGPIGSPGYWSLGRGASIAAGTTAGYEIASGKTIGDGTLSSLFHVTNLGVNHGSALFNANVSAVERFGVGINLAAGGASLFNTGDRGLQQALRSLSIATGVWNAGTQAVAAYQTSKATLEALRPTPIQVRSGGSGFYSVPAEELPSGTRGSSQSDPYLDAVTGNQPIGFTDELLDPSIASFQNVIDTPIEYAPEVGYRSTAFFQELEYKAARQRYDELGSLATQIDAARTVFELTDARKGTDGYRFGEASSAYRNLEKKRIAFEQLSGYRYEGSLSGYRQAANREFQDLWEQGLVLAPSGGNAFDSFVNGSVSLSTGIADGVSMHQAGEFRNSLGWYSSDLTAFNQDSYLYAGGEIVGTGILAYGTGAGLTRLGAFAAGFAPTTTYVVGAGATAYGGYQLYEHGRNTIGNWDNLSGPQRVSAIGVPIAGAVGGYAGYKSVPAETIFQWQSAGASSRAYTNRLASSLWADEVGTWDWDWDPWIQRRPRGGSHREMKVNGDGYDSHHMPDRFANPNVDPMDGQAIQMDPWDHKWTSSNGRFLDDATIYRAQTSDMIMNRQYRSAMAREIMDVRNAARLGSNDPSKYNGAMREMLQYARDSGQLLPKAKP